MTYILMVEEGFPLSTKVFYITVAVFAGLLFIRISIIIYFIFIHKNNEQQYTAR